MTGLIDALSQAQLDNNSRRIFHGRGGLFAAQEHLCLDWYEPVLLLTSFNVLSVDEQTTLFDSIKQVWQQKHHCAELNLVFQYRAAGQTHTEVICGEIPDPHIISENNAKFEIHLLRGQNHGLFLDMANGRRWVKQHSRDKNVLNLFSYTCAFSVMALQGGACQVVNMDMSKGALAIGKRNHLLNDFTTGARFFGHDIFKSWGKLTKLGGYDLIVVDPPSNQKGSFVATKDYQRLLKRIPQLLNPKGEVLLCLNAPELGCDFLKKQVIDTAPNLSFIERLANPAVYQDVNEQKSLKVLRYQLN
ncbi:class I SAM-dependent methyltransferase [Shewanella intestini]|uniref:Methyltransferase n=1 Tax=Shewanella intestini TaxID=2017544 RepID=A0ABS5I5D5_9GAMM|nr:MULTISPECIES: class I SAM-dependent methyltransferase [Shewanella]MBR9729244.1 methyltransferase [Shewanella intestini]MRG35389.1 methyltransferase [Shewanella sp. XMDDZSB0408]